MTEIPISWIKRGDLRIFRRLIKLFPPEFLGEYEYCMIQAFRDQLDEVETKEEYIDLWLKVIFDIIKNSIQERVNVFTITKYSAFVDIVWIIGFSVSLVFPYHLWDLYVKLMLGPIKNTSIGNFLWLPIMQYAVIGFFVGLFQWVFIRNELQFNLAWPFITSIAWSFGGLVAGGLSDIVFADLHEHLILGHLITAHQRNLLTIGPNYIFIFSSAILISVSQLWFLPKSRFRWMWIVVNMLAWLIQYQVTIYLNRTFYRIEPYSYDFRNGIGAIAAGLIIGVFLRLLFMYVDLERRSNEI